MTDYRKNADEELQIRHEDSNSWVPAVANLNIAGGFVVTLTTGQIQEIESINTEVQRLLEIASSLSNLDGDADLILSKSTEIEQRVMEVRDRTQSILTLLTNTTNPEIISIDDRLTAINTAIADVQTVTTSVRDRLGDGTNSAISRLTELQTATDTLKPDVALIAGAVRSGSDTAIGKLMQVLPLLTELKDALSDSLGNVAIAKILEILTKTSAIQLALDDGTEKNIQVLKKIRDSIHWDTPQQLTGATPIIDGVNATTASSPIAIPAGTEKLFLKCYFTGLDAIATVVVELRRGIGGVFPYDRRSKQYTVFGTSYQPYPSTGFYETDSWIEIDPCGCGEVVVHIRSLAGPGTVTVYGETSRRKL